MREVDRGFAIRGNNTNVPLLIREFLSMPRPLHHHYYSPTCTRMRLYSSLLSIAACAAQSGPWPNTVPHYPQYPTRRVTTLTGTWAYGVAPNKTDATAVTYDEISTPQTIAVPMSFDVAPAGIKGLRGTVFYRSTHACTAGTSALARFYAVNFYARLFVDGVEVGNHTAGPYTPFAFVLPACKSGGTRELALVVNNEFNSTLSPTATGGDFYFFSGLIRPVVCTELPNAAYFLDRIEPVTVDVAAGMIDVRVFVSGTAPSTITLALAFNGAPAGQPVAVPVTNGFAFMHNVTVPGGKPWTLGQGNLYTLTVTDQTTNDALTVRSGLRVVGIAPGPPARLTINGEIVKLKGFNRHHSWPDTGAAVTPAQEARDLEVLQGVNANYVRGGHYPQSQSWLDLLDEAGIALWEEALGPGVSTPDIENPYFMANQIKAVTSMVTTSVAHPSVILHGYFNEGPSSDANACVGYKALADTIHSLVGPTQRLVTWASDKTTTDKCLEFADVVSFNNYPGCVL